MSGSTIVFYDGSCGLCHASVRFLIERDSAAVLRFAPLAGETLSASLSSDARASLPDSMVLFDPASGAVSIKSEAVRRSLLLLGGGWGVVGRVMGVVPGFLRDLVYDCVARVRHRLFARPEEACPLMPADLRKRFLP